MEFRDLKRQYNQLKTNIDLAMADVISSACFISGPQVAELEAELASYVGVKYCISCANGTDAISIALLANEVGEGDAVFVPDFTFFSSGECPATVGAMPIFVDVKPDTYNIAPDSLEDAIKTVASEGKLRTRAVVAVDLFGQPAEYDAIRNICLKYGLLLFEDGAQGFGGRIGEKRACSFGDISTTSFFPAKPLGCYGDGGAIFTDDDEVAALCRSIAVHGKDMENSDHLNAKYHNVRLGMNSRLDTLQAAVLIEKFRAFTDYELRYVDEAATLYTELLKSIPGIVCPTIPDGFYSSWAQYTVQLPENVDRTSLQNFLKSYDIPTMIYYISPMHKQGAFAGTRSAIASCPITEKLCESVLCLPIHPYIEEKEIVFVVSKMKEFFEKGN